MKIFYLVYNRIKSYFYKNRLVFCLFILGNIVNSLVFTYFYGNLVTALTNRKSQDIQYRQYEAYIQSDDYSVDSLSESDLFESIAVGCTVGRMGVNDGSPIMAPVFGEPPLVWIRGQVSFLNDNEIVVPLTAQEAFGDTVTLMQNEFVVIGQHTGHEFYISYSAFQKLDLEMNIVYAVTVERQDFSDDPAYEAISVAIPNASILSPSRFEKLDNKQSVSQIILISITYAVSVISYMFLLRYIIDSMIEESVISMIVGASGATTAFLVFAETICLSVVTNALGIAMHCIFYDSLFKKINISTNLVYKFTDYIFIFMMMLTVSCWSAIPFVIKYFKLSPIDARRESM